MKPHRNVGRDHTTKVVLIQNIVDEKKENTLERNNKVNTESTSKKAETSGNKAREGSDPCRNVDRGGEDPCRTPEPTEAEATMVKKHRNQPDEMAKDNKNYEPQKNIRRQEGELCPRNAMGDSENNQHSSRQNNSLDDPKSNTGETRPQPPRGGDIYTCLEVRYSGYAMPSMPRRSPPHTSHNTPAGQTGTEKPHVPRDPQGATSETDRQQEK